MDNIKCKVSISNQEHRLEFECLGSKQENIIMFHDGENRLHEIDVVNNTYSRVDQTSKLQLSFSLEEELEGFYNIDEIEIPFLIKTEQLAIDDHHVLIEYSLIQDGDIFNKSIIDIVFEEV